MNNPILKEAESSDEDIRYSDLLNSYLTVIRQIPATDRVSEIVNSDFNGTTIQGPDPTKQYTKEDVNYDQALEWYAKGMTYAIADYQDRISGGDGKEDKSNVVSTLAKAFKDMAWTYTARSWKSNKPVIQGALMYAILVAQSLIFFISYAKRLFYVIVLILVAPIIVVYDFFTKFPG